MVPRPQGHAGRDVGFSGVFGGRSVWVFGDTFLPQTAADGLRWRSSSWSWTVDTESADGIGPFAHALDSQGLAVQLLPHTAAEARYNREHDSAGGCPAQTDCGSRRTPWPQALVVDGTGERALIYYLNMDTGPGGAWDFRSVSGSIAVWADPELPATRIEPPLFSEQEPDWGAAAVRVDQDVYVYACGFDSHEKPCLLARVPFHAATDRGQYQFFSGPGGWSEDWTSAVPVFSGGSLFSVHYNAWAGSYLAFYMAGMAGEMFVRSAPHPQGPWSAPSVLGKGLPGRDSWDYALIAHPEFSRDGGRVEILSYTRPSGFLEQEIRLVELRVK
jgi:hypothetical protein